VPITLPPGLVSYSENAKRYVPLAALVPLCNRP
jgi:hypothetical protein